MATITNKAQGAPSSSTEAGKSSRSAGVARAAGLTILLVLLSRVTGVMRDMVLSARFGQTGALTVFRAAFDVPDLIALVIAGGALSSVFIPIFTEYWNKNEEEEAWRVFGSVLTIVGLIVAVLVVGMEIGVVPLTRLLNPKFSPGGVQLASDLTKILLPVQWCLMVGGLMMGTLYARKNFLVPGLGPIFYNLGQIGGAWFFGAKYGFAAVAYGALVGAAAGNVLLPAAEMFRVGVRWKLALDFKHPGVVRMGQLMLPVLLGQSLSQLNMWLTGRFLPDDARRAALTYAYNLTQAPIGIFAQAFGIVLLPTIALLATQKDWPLYRTTVSDGLKRVFFLTIPASVLLCALASPLIRLVLKQGKFTESDVPMATMALICYSLSTFAWSGISILARGFYALQETRTPVFVTTPMVGVFIIMAFVCTKLDPQGYIGLALSTSIVGIVTMFIMLYLLNKRVTGLDLKGIASSGLRVTVSSLVAGAVAWFLGNLLFPHVGEGKLGALIIMALAGGPSLAVYAGLCYVMRVPELHTIRDMFRKPKNLPASDAPSA